MLLPFPVAVTYSVMVDGRPRPELDLSRDYLSESEVFKLVLQNFNQNQLAGIVWSFAF